MASRVLTTDRMTAMDEAVYLCDVCGEEIVIPFDPSEGDEQEFTEDCPVCCHPHTIRVVVTPDGGLECWAVSQ
jgi:DNA replicative helicase MCM subunit Mcm2 (Cdc46/Mcm family)